VKHGVRLIYAALATLGAVSACAMNASQSGELATNDNGSDVGNSSGGTGNLVPAGGTGGTQPQPEIEVDTAFRVPVVSGRWVWTANPKSGRVALIDATKFTVRTALAGAEPTFLAALPAEAGSSRAIVINSGSQDATLFSANAEGEIESVLTLPVHRGANAWAVTADGRFAVAWTDASGIKDPDPSQGFQDITVLDLGAKLPTSKRLSVGYRPARVFVDNDDLHVYVVTDAGIDVVDLTSDDGAEVASEVALSRDPANDTAKREVEMTPDGALAFVRRENKAFVTVVDMASGDLTDVTLPGPITDLDLSEDASLAVAIVRQYFIPADNAAGAGNGDSGGGGEPGTAMLVGAGGNGELAAGGNGEQAGGAGGNGTAQGGTSPGPMPASGSLAVLLPVATIAKQPELRETLAIDEVFGSVELGREGDTALLYSNVISSTHLTLLGLAKDDARSRRTLDLKLPIFSAQASPDGAHAVVLLKPPPGSKQPGAFAVVPVAKNLPPKIQGTLAPTVAADASKNGALVAMTNDRALVTVSDGASVNYTYMIRMPELTVDQFPLDSVPLAQASGIVADANQAFVAQQHPEGRITFIDLDTQELHTLTGFELSTQVSK
jgi:hypothetical protein